MTAHAPITATTWVAVFDGAKAAVFQNEGFDDAPNLRHLFGSAHEDAPTREIGTDRPGRTPTPDGGRAAVENTDFHTQAEERFVDGFAREMDAAATAGRFDRLVLIAPGKLLSRFRDQAPAAARKIAGERAGDFAHTPMAKIERAFREALG